MNPSVGWEMQDSPSFLLHPRGGDANCGVFQSQDSSSHWSSTRNLRVRDGAAGGGRLGPAAGRREGMQRSMAQPRWAVMSTSSSSIVHPAPTSWTRPVVGTGPGHRAVPIDLLVEEQVPGASPALDFNCTSKSVGQPESTKNNQPRNPNLLPEMN